MSDTARGWPQSKQKTPSREMAEKAEEARTAEAAKTARLRGLRLAKETADRDAAQQATLAALEAGATPRRRAPGLRKPPVREAL